MNIKKIALPILVALTATSIWAVPAKQGLRNLQQPDGSFVSVRVTGDESGHTFINESGETLHRDADGYLRPMTAEQLKDLQKRSKLMRKSRRSILRSAAENNNSQVPHIGSPRIPVLLVQYSDYKFKDSDPLTVFKDFFSSGSKSAHQYFYDQSNGKFDAQFDVYGPVTLSGTRATYGGNDKWGYDVGVGNMVGEACNSLNSQIDFSKYDNDGDGECDVVIVLYAGDGEASSYDADAEDAVWPCQWALSGSEFGKSLRLDSTVVDLFAVFNELNGSNLSKIDGVGTFCHEFSHCLGLPDFYDTEYGPHFGMAHWSLMDYGCYNDDGYTPIGYSAYEKEFMGWIEIPEAKENTYYTLTPLNLKQEATDMAVRLTNAADKDEYYILENRKKTGWDAYIPAEGMLIHHIAYDADIWEANTVNDEDLQRATIIPADNSLKLDSDRYGYYINEKDLLTDVWPQSYATELTDKSVPAAKVNTGKYMSKPITEIVKNSDGTISFWAMKAPLPAIEVPTNLRHSLKNSTTVEFAWDCDNENVGSYTLEVAPYIENPYTLLKEVDFTGTHGWTAAGYTGVEDGALRFGSNKNTGSVTSPAYKSEADHDCVSVIFSAKYYGTDSSSVIVSLLNNSGTVISSSTVALTSSMKKYIVTFPLAGESSFKIKFETTATKKRFYLADASIYSGDASELISASSIQRRVAEEKRVFENLTANSHVVDGLTPNGLYQYRVKAHPADAESYASSDWSEPVIMDLAVLTGIENIIFDNGIAEEWYTLQGIRLLAAPTAPGIYIRKSCAATIKIVIK